MTDARAGGSGASPAGPWVGWAAFAGLALAGFCFGVWAGTQKPDRVTVAQAPTATPARGEPPLPAKPETKPEPKPDPVPEPKPPAKPPEPKKPDPKPSAPAVTFAKDIQPVFRANCAGCHGGTGPPKGGLDLKTLAATLKGGDGGPGVKPNDPDGSPVWQRIADGSMPPDGKPRLSEKDKKRIRDWIDAGAK